MYGTTTTQSIRRHLTHLPNSTPSGRPYSTHQRNSTPSGRPNITQQSKHGNKRTPTTVIVITVSCLLGVLSVIVAVTFYIRYHILRYCLHNYMIRSIRIGKVQLFRATTNSIRAEILICPSRLNIYKDNSKLMTLLSHILM